MSTKSSKNSRKNNINNNNNAGLSTINTKFGGLKFDAINTIEIVPTVAFDAAAPQERSWKVLHGEGERKINWYGYASISTPQTQFSQELSWWAGFWNKGCKTTDLVAALGAAEGLRRYKIALGASGKPVKLFVPVHDGDIACVFHTSILGPLPSMTITVVDRDGRPTEVKLQKLNFVHSGEEDSREHRGWCRVVKSRNGFITKTIETTNDQRGSAARREWASEYAGDVYSFMYDLANGKGFKVAIFDYQETRTDAGVAKLLWWKDGKPSFENTGEPIMENHISNKARKVVERMGMSLPEMLADRSATVKAERVYARHAELPKMAERRGMAVDTSAVELMVSFDGGQTFEKFVYTGRLWANENGEVLGTAVYRFGGDQQHVSKNGQKFYPQHLLAQVQVRGYRFAICEN